MSNITLNIVEPGSTPPVPDTGLFTNGSSIGSGEAPIIAISIVVILAILTTIALVVYYRKKKQGKTPSFFTRFKHNKSTTTSLAVLALLVSIGTVAGLLKLGANAEEADSTEAQDSTALTVTAESKELTIELGDEPVFAVLPVDITVAESTPAGYTLTTYAENTNLISTTDSSSVIPMVTAPEEAELVALDDDTYGLSLVKPESQEEETYTSLSTDSTNPTFITDKDYEETEENDTTTIYYGFYITPDTPYGKYTGAAVKYIAEENGATVIYDGNGLYFNNDEAQTTNTMKYLVGVTDNTEKVSHTSNVDDNGEQIPGEYIRFGTYLNNPVVIPGATKVHVSLKYGIINYFYNQANNEYWAYMTIWQGDKPGYTAADNYSEGIKECGTMTTTDGRINGYEGYTNNGYMIPISVECDITGDAVTFGFWTQPGGGPGIGYGYYAVVTGYDEDGNIVYLQGNNPIAGEYQTPGWDLPYKFLGWNTDKDATEPTYISANDVELNASLTMGEITTFYAIWQYATNITFDGNGADGGVGLPGVLLAAGQSITLANYSNESHMDAYTKTGYYFGGWNTKADGSGTSYSPYAQFTAPTDKSENLTLYAQWQRITTTFSFNGNGADSGSMDDITVIGGESATLPENTFIRDGYNFTGWNTEADGSGTAYDNCANYTAPDEPVDITLYAQWEEDVLYMQDVASWGSNLEIGDEVAVVDSRDGKGYTVARLADGNIWMTQNLDHNIGDIDGGTYTSADTDLPSNATWTPSDDEYTYTADDTNWNSSYTEPESYDPGDLYWNGTIDTSYSGTLSNMTVSDPSATAGGTYYYIGNYYNWTAAVAMSDSSSYTARYTDANQSICPAGWRLPTHSGDKSYQNLVSAQSLTAGTSGNIQNSPVYFVYGGNWDGSSGFVGSLGYYWSSVVDDNYGAYQLCFYADSTLIPWVSGLRSSGFSIRCVAR